MRSLPRNSHIRLMTDNRSNRTLWAPQGQGERGGALWRSPPSVPEPLNCLFCREGGVHWLGLKWACPAAHHLPPYRPRWAACRGYRPWARQASNTALAKRSMLSRDRQSMSGGLASNVFRTFTSSRLNVTVMVFSACLARYFAWRSAWVMAVPVRGRPRGRLMGSRSAVW